jgi:hypothetical protein
MPQATNTHTRLRRSVHPCCSSPRRAPPSIAESSAGTGAWSTARRANRARLSLDQRLRLGRSERSSLAICRSATAIVDAHGHVRPRRNRSGARGSGDRRGRSWQGRGPAPRRREGMARCPPRRCGSGPGARPARRASSPRALRAEVALGRERPRQRVTRTCASSCAGWARPLKNRVPWGSAARLHAGHRAHLRAPDPAATEAEPNSSAPLARCSPLGRLGIS